MRPRRRRALGIAAGLCLLVLLLGAVAVAASRGPTRAPADTSEQGGDSRTDSFYDVPSPREEATAGSVLRSRPADVHLDGAPPFVATTLLYHSRSADGRDRIVSGTLLTPTGPGAGATLLVLAPGTHGLGPQCAPSRQFVAGTDYEAGVAIGALREQWSVAIPDYEGYVTGESPTYVNGPAMGHAVLDLARAVPQVPGSRVRNGAPLLLQGYSQGGAGAAWAASMAPAYAPELRLRGVAVGGVPADLGAAAEALDGSAHVYLELMALMGLAAAYPDALDLDELLNDRGRAAEAGLRRECVDGPTARSLAGMTLADHTRGGRSLEDLARRPRVAAVLTANRLADQPAPTVPIYQTHAAADEVVAIGQAQELHRTWCAAGVTTRLDVLPGDHATGGALSAAPFLAWLRASAVGDPMPRRC